MKKGLNYGRISWSYDETGTHSGVRPLPIFEVSPIRINGKAKYPGFTDKIILQLMKHKTALQVPFREAYVQWYCNGSWIDRDLGEGRAFLRWLQRNKLSIKWRAQDFKLHEYFNDPLAPRHDPDDELAKDLSFAIMPVTVQERRVKLYLQDEAVLGLINLPFGEEKDFIELVEMYVKKRFQWEEWRAPAPPFLDWVKTSGMRPVFRKGQLGFSPPL